MASDPKILAKLTRGLTSTSQSSPWVDIDSRSGSLCV